MRVGLVLDPRTFDHVMLGHVNEIFASGRHQVTLVVRDAYGLGEPVRLSLRRRFCYKPLFRLTNATAKALHIWRSRRVHPFSYWRQLRRIVDPMVAVPQLRNAEVVNLEPIRLSKYRYGYPEPLIQRIREGCDVLFLAGAGRILAGDILKAPKFGVLSFHPADTNKYKGRPGGFFEWIRGETQLGITLQRLSPHLDGGDIVLVRHIDLTQEPSLVSAMYSLTLRRRGMLGEALDRLELEGESWLRPPVATKVNHEKDAERLANMLRYVAKHVLSMFKPGPAPAQLSE